MKVKTVHMDAGLGRTGRTSRLHYWDYMCHLEELLPPILGSALNPIILDSSNEDQVTRPLCCGQYATAETRTTSTFGSIQGSNPFLKIVNFDESWKGKNRPHRKT
ncbi:hypothetical protein KC19_VG290700 [Ceratodon purpureus]|uniref:Uncharacterized protein n=1 Tax=Ceratodon purpureus TaxID=3225 RepID=A0A8T0HVQ0_CERPU|nr:hypothetical protein KC19_VG290700 [Ceratodon purpureus]